MKAAHELLAGPMQTCRIMNKLYRWKAAIASYIESDKEKGLYPSIKGDPENWEQTAENFIQGFQRYISRMRESVSCNRSYSATAWGPVVHPPIAPMLKIDNVFSTGPWKTGPVKEYIPVAWTVEKTIYS